MKNTNGRPNVIIPGSAKCGTTSLYHYLIGHPEIYIPKQYKELGYYVPDAMGPVRTEHDYRELYTGPATYQKKALIDISTAYLYPKDVPLKVCRDLGRDIKVVVFLREPAGMAFSLWKQMIRTGRETLRFSEAIQAESRRMSDPEFGLNIRGWPCNYFYRARAEYFEQVKRYIDVFGNDRVRVFVYETFFSALMPQWKELLRFLDVDANYRPNEFGDHNPGGATKYEWFRRLIEGQSVGKRVLKRFIPAGKKVALLHWLYKLNTKEYRPTSDDLDAIRNLQGQLAGDIQKLSELIGQDLIHIWGYSEASAERKEGRHATPTFR